MNYRVSVMVMKPEIKEGLLRLAAALLLNVGLWMLFPEVSKWSSVEREIRLSLLAGSLAAPAFVILVPCYWRGDPRYVPFAFLLMVLPGFMIFQAASTALKYW